MKTKYSSVPLPAAPSHLVTDEYHGIKVEDHYRNLENLEGLYTVTPYMRNVVCNSKNLNLSLTNK